MKLRKLLTAIIYAFVLLVGSTRDAKAAAIQVNGWADIEGASFIDLPGSDSLAPITFDSLVITADQPVATGAFAGFAKGTIDNPADGNGYFATTTGIGGRLISSITLNFSSPLAAFGVTFQHFPAARNIGNDAPALLQVFDGPNGSGNLVGSITSSGLITSDLNGNPDFVAIWSDLLNIRSAVLTGTGPSHGFAVDAYATSFTPRVTTVEVRIKPDGDPNSINLRSNGVIPVAILTTDTFDATTVDPATVRLGPTRTEAAAVQATLVDVDGDGHTDLLLHFRTQDTGLTCGDWAASLAGKTFLGQPIEGYDVIRVVGCK